MFDIKLACDNCGKYDFYKLPLKAKWLDCDSQTADGQSGFSLGRKDFLVPCKNCGLHRLKAVFWNFKEADEALIRERNGFIDSSEPS